VKKEKEGIERAVVAVAVRATRGMLEVAKSSIMIEYSSEYLA